jgi:signal transduction histidine kinase
MLKADPMVAGVTIEIEAEPLEGEVDAGQLKQVLINLIRNAVAATHGKGRIRVSAKHRVGERLHVAVWDSAGSISPEDQGHVFDPFFTRRPDGTGLGLSTVQSIVRAHGGTVSVDSAPERGTTFSLDL